MLTGNWESANKPVHERFVELAEAYRQAAMDFCDRMRQWDSECTWANANVVLLLSAHAVELFLKGAILAKSPDEEFGAGHRLDLLHQRFDALFAASGVTFEPFFRTEYPGFTASEVAALSKGAPIQSILYRYPVDRSGAEWPGIHAFEPADFFELLDTLGNDFERIEGHL
jgi:hypothetical protein